MRGLVIFLLIVVVMASFSFVAANINNVEHKKETKQETKHFEFSTFTSAVCESKEDFVNCKDEVFVNCDGKVSKATDIKECNGFYLNSFKATGAAVFGKEWKDPRG